MSNPPNPLADFQTYAYQHILLVCDGYETVKALSDSTDMDVYRRAPASTDPYQPKQIDGDPERQYVVLIDSTTDVRYSITNVTWETMIAPMRAGKNKDGMRYGDTMEVDGIIDINEPFGVQLYETLATISVSLGRDPAGLVYMLKTFFVGHHSNGTTEVIPNVRPFVFNLIDINSVIDFAGTTYRLDIVGSANGLAKLPQHQMAGEKVSLGIEAGDTVGSMMAKLEGVIQTKYTKWKNKTFEEIQQNDRTIELSEIQNRFQDVLYTFGTDPVYSSAEYAVKKPDTESATLSSGPHGTLESMIRRIIGSAPQCDQDATGKNGLGKRYMHKIISYPKETNTGQLEIRHMIHRFELPTQTKNGQLIKPQPGEAIEFDFMYTGKNTDVLNFDIKMDMGLSFFMTYANGKHLPSTTTEDTKGVAKPKVVGAGKAPSSNPAEVTGTDKKVPRFPATKTPLYLGKTISDPYNNNKADSLSGMSYDAAMEKHAALEHVEAHLKIHGNPNLLDEMINTSGVGTKATQEGNTGAADVTRTPALIKVNVRFPNGNDFKYDETTNSGTKDFWYRGYYNIYSIQQSFQDGLFQQDITMFSIPVVEANGIDKASQDPSRYDTEPGKVEPQPGAPCTIEPFPYDIIQGVKNNPNTAGFFIPAVEQIAARLGTLPEWMLTVMSFETSGTFSPGQTTTASTAVGLIQFLESTAIDLGTTKAALADMSSTEQLVWVEKYLAQRVNQGDGLNTLEGLYTAVLSGTPTNQPSHIQFSINDSNQANYNANKPLDINNDGDIRVGESITFACSRMFGGVGAIQRKLKASGIEQAAKDAISQGKLTQATLDAIRDYQILNELVETGYLNDETGRHLFDIPPAGTAADGSECKAAGADDPLNQQLHNPLFVKSGLRNEFKVGFKGEVPHTGPLAKFSAPEFGFAQGMKLLSHNYYTNSNLYNVRDIITKWAGKTDRTVADRKDFIASVSDTMGVSPTFKLDLVNNEGQLLAMAKAIAAYYGGENYTPYTDDTFRSAIAIYRN